jgi:hypothetical protein
MIDQHPITPPPEQADQWFDDAMRLNSTPKYYIVRQAALWGADQELEACITWLRANGYPGTAFELNDLRRPRPKPPTLKEQALESVKRFKLGQDLMGDFDIIQQALEAQP